MSLFDTLTDSSLDKMFNTISSLTFLKKQKKTKVTQSITKTEDEVIQQILSFADKLIIFPNQQVSNSSIGFKELEQYKQKIIYTEQKQKPKKQQSLTESRKTQLDLTNKISMNSSLQSKLKKHNNIGTPISHMAKKIIQKQTKQIQKKFEKPKILKSKRSIISNNQSLTNILIKTTRQSERQNIQKQQNPFIIKKSNINEDLSSFPQSRISVVGQPKAPSKYMNKKSNNSKALLNKLIAEVIKQTSKESKKVYQAPVQKSFNTSKKYLNLSGNEESIYDRSKQMLSKKQNFIKFQKLNKQQKQLQSATFKPKLNVSNKQMQQFEQRLESSIEKKIRNKARIIQEELKKTNFKPKINNHINAVSKIKKLWSKEANGDNKIQKDKNLQENESIMKSFFSEEYIKPIGQVNSSSFRRIEIKTRGDLNYLLQ